MEPSPPPPWPPAGRIRGCACPTGRCRAGGGTTPGNPATATVRGWGRDADGQLGDGTVADHATGPPGSSTPVQVSGITGAAAVIAGGYHTCALFADGTAWCWGRSDDGQLGNGARASASTPVPVTNLTGVTAMTAGFYHTCALLPNGTVWCWGRNDEGQLGDGTTLGRPAPVQVAGIT